MTFPSLLDTSIWIQHMRGAEPVLQRVHDLAVDGTLLTCEPVVMELLVGMSDREAEIVERISDQTPSLAVDQNVDFRVAADLARRVRASGHTIRSPFDALIAAVVLRHPDVVLIHDDTDFDRIAAVVPLRHERWSRAGTA